MIDDETRARAKAFTESNAAQVKSEFQAMKDKDDAEYSAGFDADERASGDEGAIATPVVTASATGKPLAAAASAAPTFKETFAAQRKAGASSFDWNGKKYSTALAKEKIQKPSPTAAISASKAEEPAHAAESAKPAATAANYFPANRPHVNIYAKAGISGEASPETKAARANMAASLAGKDSLAAVMARKTVTAEK